MLKELHDLDKKGLDAVFDRYDTPDEASIWFALVVNVGVFAAGALLTVVIEYWRARSHGGETCECTCRGIYAAMKSAWSKACKANHESVYKRPSIKFHMEDLPGGDDDQDGLDDSSQDPSSSLRNAGDMGSDENADAENTSLSRRLEGSIMLLSAAAANSDKEDSPVASPSQRKTAGAGEAALSREGDLQAGVKRPQRRHSASHELSTAPGHELEPLTLPVSPRRHTAGGIAEKRRTSPHLLAPPVPLVKPGHHPQESSDKETEDSDWKSDNSESSRPSGLGVGSGSQPTVKSMAPGLAAHTSYTNYLCFMKVLQAMFGTLSLISMVFITLRCYWWGFCPFFGGTIGGRISLVRPMNSLEPDLDPFGVVLLYVMTWTYGLVIVVFTELLQASCNDMPVIDLEVAEKINRSVWLRWLPTGDKRTRRKFLMSDGEFERVAADLKGAIEERLTKKFWTDQKKEQAAKELGVQSRRLSQTESSFTSSSDKKWPIQSTDSMSFDGSLTEFRSFMNRQRSQEGKKGVTAVLRKSALLGGLFGDHSQDRKLSSDASGTRSTGFSSSPKSSRHSRELDKKTQRATHSAAVGGYVRFATPDSEGSTSGGNSRQGSKEAVPDADVTDMGTSDDAPRRQSLGLLPSLGLGSVAKNFKRPSTTDMMQSIASFAPTRSLKEKMTGRSTLKAPLTFQIDPKRLPKKRCVERVEVPPVTTEWHKTCKELRTAVERAESYNYMETNYRIMEWWYRRQARKSTVLAKRLRTKLLKIILGHKKLCGCAFVTFTNANEKMELLSHDKPSWWEVGRIWRGYSHFTFGRPPFASVTLKCEQAPHPDDILWENLQTSAMERLSRFWISVIFLTGFLLLLVTPNTLRSIFVIVGREIFGRSPKDKTVESWFNESFYNSFGRLLEFLWGAMVGKMLSMLLLLINTLILPYMIQYIAEAEKSHRKSTIEQRALRLNFVFMVLNLVFMPMLQVTSITEIAQLTSNVTGNGGFQSMLGYIGEQMARGHGVFTIQYLLNATFISSVIALASSVRQDLFREITLTFFAVTDRDRQAAYTPELFAWGYWYAWALAITCMTMVMSVLVPGTLPIATILFTLRYHIDRYNLDNSIYELGSESNGAFVLTVVHHMRSILSIMWFMMGCFFLTETCQDVGPAWITNFGSYVLCLSSLVIGLGNLFFSMYRFWWTKMVEMHDSENWMKRLQGRVEKMRAAGTQYQKFLAYLQNKLQLTKSIVGTEHLIGRGEDTTWKVGDRQDYIWNDNLVESMLRVLNERFKEEGKFTLTARNLQKHGFETSELSDFFDIDEGDEQEEEESSDSERSLEQEKHNQNRASTIEVEMASASTFSRREPESMNV